MWVRRVRLLWVQGPLFVQRATIKDVFDPTAIWDESLFCNHVFKLIHLKLSKSPLLGDVHLLVTRELGLAEGLNHMLLVLQFGANGHYDLANVDPGHCAWDSPKVPCIPVWSLDWGQHANHECSLLRTVSKVPYGNLYRQQAAYTYLGGCCLQLICSDLHKNSFWSFWLLCPIYRWTHWDPNVHN